MTLSHDVSLSKRDALISNGYTVIKGVINMNMIEELRVWSDKILSNTPVPHDIRYQGSDFFVHTERSWSAMAPEKRDLLDIDPCNFPDPMATQIIDHPLQLNVCRKIGLENLKSHEKIIILSKPSYGPPLYWHQDFMQWDSPQAATPWPTQIFLSYYLVETTRENGCLRVIPGSHRKRHKLHDILPEAHGKELQAVEDLSHPAFADYPDAVDVPLGAGDLLIGDARLLHAAWPNQSDQRRTLLLAWHEVFSFPQPPSWWTDDYPTVVKNASPTINYENTVRKPSSYIV